MSTHDENDETIVEHLHDFDTRLSVPSFTAVRERAERGSGLSWFAQALLVSAALIVAVGVGIARLSQSPAATASAPTTVLTAAPGSAPVASSAFGLLIAGTGDDVGVRAETAPTLLRSFTSRTFAVSPDGRRVAYWRTGPEDALPHVLHVLDLRTGSDRTVLTLATERAGSAGWMVWASDGARLAIAVHAEDSAFAGRLSPHLPSASAVRLVDVSTGQVREAMRTTKGWLDPIGLDARGQLVAIVRGADDRVVDYLVRDASGADARSLTLAHAVDASSVRADAAGGTLLGLERTACGVGQCGAVWTWPADQPASAVRATSSDVNAQSAVFRPATGEILSIVRDASNATAIQRWSSPGSAPAQIVRLPALGRLVFRSDGSALIATQTDLNRGVAYLIDPASARVTELSVTSDVLASVALGPLATSATPSPAARATDSISCGPWSSATSATGSQFAANYGEIRNCLRVGQDWVILTVGAPTSHGVAAVYRCTDAQCLQPDVDHPFDNWIVVPAPNPGGVTLFGQPDDHHLLVSNGGRQLLFDTTSLTFSQP